MNPSNFFVRRLLPALLVIFNAIAMAHAQADTATLTGRVTDPNGAAVAGANVTAINQATNLSSSATTNDEGFYTFASLKPGLYTVEVSQTGFDKAVRNDYELNVGRSFRFDVGLQVGTATVAVDVTGEQQSLLQRDEATIGNIVDNRRITTLPLPQRSWDGSAATGRRNAGRSVHRAIRRYGLGPHRFGQHPRRPLAAEQLHPRRAGQQLDLDQRAGIFDAGVAPVDRFARRVSRHHLAVLR
jgi:hypothetical protein